MAIPILAAALPSIGSFLAEKGLGLLRNVFSGTVNAGMKKVAESIKDKTGIDINDAAEGKLTDEQVVKLKEFELQHEQMLLEHTMEMRGKEIEEERIHQADRASARGMQEKALEQDDKFAKRFIYWYAAGVTALTFAFIFYVTIKGTNTANARIVDTVLGFLLGVSLSAVIQFFFGSSKGSADKQRQLSELTRKLQDVSSKGTGI